MTIVTNTSTTHSGLLVTGPGDAIEIDVELIGGRTLRLSADGAELGAWPVEDCHIEEDPERNASFRIIVDGDDAVFTPTDPVRFRTLVRGLAGTDAVTEYDPVPPPGTGVDTDTRAGDAAAHDPVAFLFGSSPSPVQAGPSELSDFDEPDDIGTTDAAPDRVPSIGESAADPPRDFLPDDDVTIDGGAVDETSVDLDPVDVEPVDVDPVDVDPVDVDPVDVDPVDQAETTQVEAVHPTLDDVIVEDSVVDELFATEPEPDPEPEFPLTDDTDDDAGDVAGVVEELGDGGGEGIRGRFGGSALDRLSAAIGSITSSSAATEEQEDPYELGPNTVAEDVLSTQRTLRDHQLKEAVRGKRLKMAGWFIGVVAVVALFSFLTPRAMEFIQNYEGGAEPPPTLPVSATTVPTPTTTVVVDETDSPGAAPVSTVADPGGISTIFDRPAPEFVALWDSIAAPIDEVLEFDASPVLGTFEEQFTPYLSLVGVVEPQGTIEEFSVVVDPSGPANYDRVGLQALGVAIATVDPARTPAGRAALLGELGLNVRQPDLEGIDGTVESGGIVYTLTYDEATTLLTLTVAPAD